MHASQSPVKQYFCFVTWTSLRRQIAYVCRMYMHIFYSACSVTSGAYLMWYETFPKRQNWVHTHTALAPTHTALALTNTALALTHIPHTQSMQSVYHSFSCADTAHVCHTLRQCNYAKLQLCWCNVQWRLANGRPTCQLRSYNSCCHTKLKGF